MLRSQYEALSRDKKILFMHIPKTAGISFTQILKKSFPDKRFFPSHGPARLLQDFHSNERQYDIFSGHFFYDIAKNFSEKPITLTFLRSPSARVISHYYFYKSYPDELISDLPNYDREIVELTRAFGLKDFLNMGDIRIENAFSNLQTRMLANNTGFSVPTEASKLTQLSDLSIQNLRNTDFIGIVEHFDDSIKLFNKMFSVDAKIKQEPLNVNRKKPTKMGSQSECFGENSIAMHRIRCDQRLYEEGIRLFNANLQRYGL
ncbi:MAG: sulfotransferase family 2 domain-containing protein [Cyanobacteria bacterium P01_H01_bin.15]